MRTTLFILCLIVALIEARQPLPKYIQPCRRSDSRCNECFAKKANLALRHIAKGDPTYKMEPLIPLVFKGFFLAIKIPTFVFYLNNITAYGIQNFTVTDAKVDFHNKKFQYTLVNKEVIWKAKYKAIADISDVHQETEGNATICFRDGAYRAHFEYELNKINGVEYANITRNYIEFLKYHMHFNLGGLDYNPLVHDAWKKVKKNFVNDRLTMGCAHMNTVYINNILNVVPFNEVFPP